MLKNTMRGVKELGKNRNRDVGLHVFFGMIIYTQLKKSALK